ncbi:MAG: PadR family transcriptional regulator [Chloroflexi bacterium]|nr:PadR family transcriptional regulator [Chloroflexota bacterium]
MSLSRELFLGFVKTHILFHAGQGPVYGLWLMEELSRHGYTLSAGSLYPMLHNLEREGLLVSEKQVIAGKARKCYRLTRAGRKALRQAQDKAIELLNEIRDDLITP